ncbi:MAG TPA: hypothetical protein VKA84_17480 [Gemmatimonadaceae bacterium]|nr:hypothetical protein [Gemmatimonadaceae bacterium]
MNELLRDRILRKLEGLPDERLYQVLDYVEFLDSKYAARQNPPGNVFQRFAEGVEDKLRAGRVSAATISETMNLMNRAMNVLSGVAAAGKSVASDIVSATGPRPGTGGAGGTAGAGSAGGSTSGTSSQAQSPPTPPSSAGTTGTTGTAATPGSGGGGSQSAPGAPKPQPQPQQSSPPSPAAQPQSPGEQTK